MGKFANPPPRRVTNRQRRRREHLTTAEVAALILGHRNIQHTVRYTELAPDRFQGFWSD